MVASDESGARFFVPRATATFTRTGSGSNSLNKLFPQVRPLIPYASGHCLPRKEFFVFIVSLLTKYRNQRPPSLLGCPYKCSVLLVPWFPVILDTVISSY